MIVTRTSLFRTTLCTQCRAFFAKRQGFEERHLQTLAGIPQEQRRKFIALLQETTVDAPSIALHAAAMHDYEAQPDPWNDWRDVGKALAEFHYLRGMKGLIREVFDPA